MSEHKVTIGSAIDAIINILTPLEGKARETVLGAIRDHFEMPIITKSGEGSPPSKPAGNHSVDIRSLRQEKNPATASQMACLIAYYLAEKAPTEERKETINAQDLEKYFKQAGFKLPKHLKQLLVDAKNSGYLEATAAGTYKLNPVGYNLVVHSLPKSEK